MCLPFLFLYLCVLLCLYLPLVQVGTQSGHVGLIPAWSTPPTPILLLTHTPCSTDTNISCIYLHKNTNTYHKAYISLPPPKNTHPVQCGLVCMCGWVMKKCVAIHCSWLPNQPDRPPFLFWHAIHCIVGPHKCAIHSMCIVEVYSMYSMFTNIFAYMQCILNMLHDWLECSDKSWQLRHTTNQPCHQIHTDLLHWKQRQSRNSSAQIGLHMHCWY